MKIVQISEQNNWQKVRAWFETTVKPIQNEITKITNISNVEYSDFVANFKRSFHINTIIGRMLQSWLIYPRNLSVDQIDKYFRLWKDELGNAIHKLDDLNDRDINSGEIITVLSNAKELFPYSSKSGNFADFIKRALDIEVFVTKANDGEFYHEDSYRSMFQNYRNFIEIATEEGFVKNDSEANEQVEEILDEVSTKETGKTYQERKQENEDFILQMRGEQILRELEDDLEDDLKY